MHAQLEVVAGFLALALGTAGCAEPEIHTEHAVIEGTVESVTVDVRSGDVRVRGADVSEVSVTARIEGASNHLGQALTGGKLSLVDDCHENHCAVDIDAVHDVRDDSEAPRTIDAFTRAGDIAVNGY